MSKQNSKPNNSRRGNSKERTPRNSQPLPMRGKPLDSKGRSNDPNYYFTDSTLAEQASQLSFQEILGPSNIDGKVVPTIMILKMNPCPGLTYNTSNPVAIKNWTSTDWNEIDVNQRYDEGLAGINMAALKLYSLLGNFSGRATTYAPQDVAMLLLSVASMAENAEDIRRAFGLTFTYNARNRDFPKGIIESLGFDADDMMDHLAEYRMKFNTILTRANQIPMLDNIGFIRKSREMYQKIFADSASSMAQMYAYVPYSFWVLDETVDPNGTRLVTTYRPGNKISDAIDLLEMQLNALLTSTTYNIIYSDLNNLSSKMNVPTWHFDYLVENYPVIPTVERNAMLQIHNVIPIGAPMSIVTDETFVNVWNQPMTVTAFNDVISDPNNNQVIYNPGFPLYAAGIDADAYYQTWKAGTNPIHSGFELPLERLGDILIDMDTDAPNLEDRIEATRFQAAFTTSRHWFTPTGETAKDVVLHQVALPDHYCVTIVIMNSGKATDNVPSGHPSLYAYATTWDEPTSDYIFSRNEQALNRGVFDWAPLQRYAFIDQFDPTDAASMKDSECYLLSDLNYFTKVDTAYLSRLNRLEYTGLFDFRM